MIALLQRVTHAGVHVDGACIAEIGAGLMILVGVLRDDQEADAGRLAQRIATYRVFSDDAGRMNRSVSEVEGDVLLVPQFTLAADTASGTRPGFSTAAAPERARVLFDRLCEQISEFDLRVATGSFGADMQISLVNDGPVTFWLAT